MVRGTVLGALAMSGQNGHAAVFEGKDPEEKTSEEKNLEERNFAGENFEETPPEKTGPIANANSEGEVGRDVGFPSESPGIPDVSGGIINDGIDSGSVPAEATARAPFRSDSGPGSEVKIC